MDIKQLNTDIKNGVLWDDLKRYLRLGCCMDSIHHIFATTYETTKDKMRVICSNEARKRMRTNVVYTMEKQAHKRKTEDRNQQIKFRFYDLYEKERLRLDDTIKKVSEEFFLSEVKIVEIIRGAIATGEMELSTSSIIQRFNKPHRKDKENACLQMVVDKLKQEYEQTAAKQ